MRVMIWVIEFGADSTFYSRCNSRMIGHAEVNTRPEIESRLSVGIDEFSQ